MNNKELQVKLNELINLVNGLKNDGHITEKQRRSLNSCIKSAYLFKAHRDSFLKCMQEEKENERT